jgi:LacI family transcriptional regulator, galactose operon repressor
VDDGPRQAEIVRPDVLAHIVTSITEVARLAGVSVATASRVVSEANYAVSPSTRQRVLEAARTLDYVPNALARGLLKNHVPVVGVIVHDITDPYFSEIVRGVEDAASSGGHLVVTCSSERDAVREIEYVRLLRSMRVAAVVFAGSGIDDPTLAGQLPRHVRAITAYGGTVVHLSPHALGEPEVSVDNAAGIATMVGALVRLGHRRIAFLAGPPSLFVARDRLAGYRRGLAASAIEPDDGLVISTTFDGRGGADGVDALVGRGAAFTALVCANDLIAIGALARLADLGIRVPDEVSVAGFDDIATAALTSPGLSTVRLPLRELGRRGFAFARLRLAGGTPSPEILPTALVLRESTAPPPARPVTARLALPRPSRAMPTAS